MAGLGLVPAIHVFPSAALKTWMPGPRLRQAKAKATPGHPLTRPPLL